ncbi:Spherulation-specific family 4 [Penicillium alfredii]|uniref:Spherulation-specific family 4 n=1 Tax=Penicillium alfredii TaxID=1506179 RepID=A0A9W9KHT9_9EURO|nr:Spherulation-specific family 4 [Penicillium alfredii]KAJ5105707.1 Spherulation-specific family 4 [Penicillium alfredii]
MRGFSSLVGTALAMPSTLVSAHPRPHGHGGSHWLRPYNSNWDSVQSSGGPVSSATATPSASYIPLTSVAPTASSSAVSSASPVGVLLPLYTGPGENGDAWKPVYNAITSHSMVPFYVIINPDSGPGTTEEYIQAITKLKSSPNVQLLGYVPTTYAEKPNAEIEKVISTYGNWASYTANNITLSGMFFDEAPNTNDNAKIKYMQNIAQSARSKNMNTVVFNPGAKLEDAAAAQYFEAADFIVEFEKDYTEWQSESTEEKFSTTQYRSKDAVIVKQTPEDADIAAIVRDASNLGIGAVYLTHDGDYMRLDSVSKVALALAQA